MQTSRTCDVLFDTWTEYSSYILGFWWADGHIYLLKSPKCRRGYLKAFVLTNSDFDIMNIIGTILSHKVRSNTRKHWLPEYQVKVCSDKLFDYCYGLVGSTHKSDAPLTIPDIPEPYLNHFVRGYFDGDGSIHWINYKNRHGKLTRELRSSFTAGNNTGIFLEQLSSLLNLLIGTKHKNITRGNNRKLIFGQYDTMKLCSWLYENATIFMARKKAIWDAADKQKLSASLKYHRKP